MISVGQNVAVLQIVLKKTRATAGGTKQKILNNISRQRGRHTVYVPGVLPDTLPHGDEYCSGDEAVLDDEGEEVGARVLHDVAHEGRAAARVVAREVHHARPDQVVVV